MPSARDSAGGVMAWTSIHPEPVPPLPPWRLWNPPPGDDCLRANFYTPAEPYLRKSISVTRTGKASRQQEKELMEEAEARVRAEGFVTLPELSEEVVRYWAEQDAIWLAAWVLAHLAGEA